MRSISNSEFFYAGRRSHVQRLSGWFALVCLIQLVGCNTLTQQPISLLDQSKARSSFLKWNKEISRGQPFCKVAPSNMHLASLPKEQLQVLISTCPPPSPETLQGHWLGINRGMGAALSGKSQFVKRFEVCNPADHVCTDQTEANPIYGCGTNVTVHQVPVERLVCCGWIPRMDLITGRPHTRGNYLIVQRQGLELDYTLGENPWFDPAKFLVDDLVQVDHDLLLGRANLQFFHWRIPIAYFTLTKAN